MKGNDKCYYCSRVFGEHDKDGFMVHQFDQSNSCTACQVFTSREAEASRRNDYNESWSANHGRRSGGPAGAN